MVWNGEAPAYVRCISCGRRPPDRVLRSWTRAAGGLHRPTTTRPRFVPLHLHRCRPAPRPQLHPRGDQPTGDPGQYRFNDLSKRVRIEHPASREHHHAEKEASTLAYGYTGSFQTAEYDHLIPLELGGDPNDSLNLWVEPNDMPGATTTSNSKDVLENHLNYLVCSGQISLFAAQVEISYNWVNTCRTFVGALPSPTTPRHSTPVQWSLVPSDSIARQRRI